MAGCMEDRTWLLVHVKWVVILRICQVRTALRIDLVRRSPNQCRPAWEARQSYLARAEALPESAGYCAEVEELGMSAGLDGRTQCWAAPPRGPLRLISIVTMGLCRYSRPLSD